MIATPIMSISVATKMDSEIRYAKVKVDLLQLTVTYLPVNHSVSHLVEVNYHSRQLWLVWQLSVRCVMLTVTCMTVGVVYMVHPMRLQQTT